MLRNLSAGNIDTNHSWMALHAYLHSLKEKPARIAAAIATLVIPGAALGWWYYSFAMTLGAVSPLRARSQTPELQVPDPQSTSAPVASPSDSTPPAATGNPSDANSSGGTNVNSSQTSVEVNGQQIAVPDNGSTHQVIQNENGKTTVDIQTNSNTSGSSQTHSSTSVRMQSSSSADLNVKSREVR